MRGQEDVLNGEKSLNDKLKNRLKKERRDRSQNNKTLLTHEAVKSKLIEIIDCTKQVEIHNEKPAMDKQEAMKKNQFLQTEVTQKTNMIKESHTSIKIINHSCDINLKRNEHSVGNLHIELNRTNQDHR